MKTSHLCTAVMALALMCCAPVVTRAAGMAKTQTVKGEVLDLSCYLSHGAHGFNHAKCARACLNAGGPMGLLTKDGKLYVVVLDHDAMDVYKDLTKKAADTVTVTGVVETKHGITTIAPASEK